MNAIEIKEAVKNGKQEKRIVYFGKIFNKTPSWEDFYHIFNKSLQDKKAGMYFPGTLVVDNSEQYSECFNEITSLLDSVHGGERIAALSIIHFANAHDNTIPEDAKDFYEKFFIENKENNLPPDFNLSLLKPMVHSDPVDGFYVQCNGQTTWRAVYEDHTEEYIVNPGDMLYIPSGVNHSVESMNVRNAVSISFMDA